MKKCYLCEKNAVTELINFGKQPVAHRFLKSNNEKEYSGPIVLGQCEQCALIQQLDPMPVSELKSRFEWLTRVEPERHLDDLVQKLVRLPGITKDSRVFGISWKEDTTLKRLNALGYLNTYRLQKADLGIEDLLSDVETIQAQLTFKQSQEIVKEKGQADIVISRHLVEHAFDIKELLRALKNLLRPGGYLVLEIPDCQRSMDFYDYTTIWEEHILYFTPVTFKAMFAYGGFSLMSLIKEDYPLEYSYIGIAQVHEKVQPKQLDVQVLTQEFERAKKFANHLMARRKELKEYLMDYKKKHGKIAIFGAGHMCATFINILQLKECFEFVVDDNPHKKGMYMPGSLLPILGSNAILERDIKLCLLTLSPASEENVLKKNHEFVTRGGLFKSIFPANPQALYV